MQYSPLTSVAKALDYLLRHTSISSTPTKSLPLVEALGHCLAITPYSNIRVPSHDNSAMDGYALNTDSLNKPIPVSARIAAGHTPSPLKKGTAARIFTGAYIPKGANAVVMQEQVTTNENNTIICTEPVNTLQHIRKAGEDIAIGQHILAVNQKLRPQDIAMAASVGVSELDVFAKPKISVFFTGDELQELGKPLIEGKLYNSNRYNLIGLLSQLGCEIVDLDNIPDNLPKTKQALLQAAKKSDLILTTGGVSVGEEDHVKAALEALGTLKLWKIAMKPGKPLAFGEIDKTSFIGLPGNPVSAFVSFCIFVRPVIQKMSGQTDFLPPTQTVITDFDWQTKGRQEYLRANVHNQLAQIYPNQSSGVLTSLSYASGLIVIPPNSNIRQGDEVCYMPFSELLH